MFGPSLARETARGYHPHELLYACGIKRSRESAVVPITWWPPKKKQKHAAARLRLNTYVEAKNKHQWRLLRRWWRKRVGAAATADGQARALPQTHFLCIASHSTMWHATEALWKSFLYAVLLGPALYPLQSILTRCKIDVLCLIPRFGHTAYVWYVTNFE